MEVKILFVPGCKCCDRIITDARDLKEEFSMDIEVIDVTTNLEMLEKYPIFSSPGIVINSKLVSTGDIGKETLRGLIQETQPGPSG